MTLRVMHIDDEPDIREVVEMSLHLDPDLMLRSCASGKDALSQVESWMPDLILLDVMMPVMDGPTTLARLRETRQAAGIPVVFMTARAQPRELEHFRSLGAAGVIAKPFDPMSLAVSLRSYFKVARMNTLRANFLQRARSDADELARLARSADRKRLDRIKAIAHGLAGASGIYGLAAISENAAAVEGAAAAALPGGPLGALDPALQRLLLCIEASASESIPGA